jgi:hypothetical protein
MSEAERDAIADSLVTVTAPLPEGVTVTGTPLSRGYRMCPNGLTREETDEEHLARLNHGAYPGFRPQDFKIDLEAGIEVFAHAVRELMGVNESRKLRIAELEAENASLRNAVATAQRQRIEVLEAHKDAATLIEERDVSQSAGRQWAQRATAAEEKLRLIESVLKGELEDGSNPRIPYDDASGPLPR